MSGLLDQAGLTAGSGLSNGAGLYKWGNFNPFDPTDLDPYLLFDTAAGSMIGTLENPTLDLDPSNQETLDVITATRAGIATYTDPDGNIATASADTVRVDYTQGAELTPTVYQHFGQTNFDDPAWQKITTSITAGDALAPDGTATADRMVIPPTANSQSSRLTEESNITSGTTVTISFYAKADGSINPLVLFSNGSVFARILFNLQSETSSFVDGALSITHSIEEAANGFYRCSATFNSAGIGSISIRNATAGDGVSSLLLWGPQLEEGTTASSFVANTTGSPKFITGATYGPRVPMILVEPSATNLVEYSEDFNNSAWSKTSYGTGVVPVVTANNAISPDGTQNASRVVFGTGGGTTSSEESFLTDTISTTIGVTYTESVYLKGDVGGEQILMRGAGGSGYTTLTLTTEWVRYEVTEVETYDTTTYFQIGLRQGLGGVVINSEITVYIWGAQFETGSVATSYIPTSGGDAAARTRASDELVISGSDFTDFYNGSAGTFFIQAQNRTPELNGAVLMGQNSNRLFFYKSNPNRLSTYDGGSFTHHDGLVANQLFNAAVTFNTSNRSLSLDGSALDTDTINTNWAGADILKIGFGYSNNFNGHYRRIIYWPLHSDSL